MLSEKWNMEAAQRFFRQAVAVVGHAPDQVTTDGHRSYPRAILETMGSHVHHRTNKYLNNRLEPGSPWHQATILSHAWLWDICSGSTFLLCHRTNYGIISVR